jgi:hypothetical protein
MARSAIDFETVVTALDISLRDLDRDRGHVFSVLFSRETGFIQVQLSTRNGVVDGWPGSTAVAEEISLGQRLVLWLVVHILPAGRSGERHSQSDKTEE